MHSRAARPARARVPVRRAPSRVVRRARILPPAPMQVGPVLGRRPPPGSQVASWATQEARTRRRRAVVSPMVPHRQGIPRRARAVPPRLAPPGRPLQIQDRLAAPPAPAPTTVSVAMPMLPLVPLPAGMVLVLALALAQEIPGAGRLAVPRPLTSSARRSTAGSMSQWLPSITACSTSRTN